MNFFLYGTLMDPHTLRTIAGIRKFPKMFTGYVRGYMKITVPECPYPLLVQGDSLTMSGLIWENVLDKCVARMVAYEGSHYTMKEVLAQLVGRAKEVPCQLFVPIQVFTTGWSLKNYQRSIK